MGLGMQIASLFATVGVNTDPLKKGLGGAKQSLQQFGGEMAKQVVGTVTLAGAVYKAGQTIVDSIRDWTDYADAMRLSAQMAGVTTEEMSRLVQAADDFRVPMETMQQAMEMALKNGFVPTIENLAELSDRLMGISDPALRAAEASQIFGKSYADIMPFLLAGGDAIRESTDSIDKNLVVTEKAAEEAKAYKDALDDLGDSWTGLKNVMGKALTPMATNIFTGLTKDMQEFFAAMSLISVAFKAWDQGKIDFETFLWYIDDSMFRLGESVGPVGVIIGEVYSKLSDSAGTDFLETTNAHIEELNAVLDGTPAKAVAAEESLIELAGVSLAAARSEYTETARVLKEDLAGAYDAVRDAEQNWRGGVAGQIKSGLDQALADGKINAEEYITALETLDSYAGTQFAYEFKIEESIPDLVKSLIEDPAGFLSDMATFENAMMPLDQAVQDSMALVGELQGALNDLEREYIAKVKVILDTAGIPSMMPYSMPGVIPFVPFGPQPVSEQGTHASGGYAVSNTPYIVGERGPELFVPNANGQIVANDMAFGGGNSEMLGDILMELQSQPSRIKVAVREAMALVGG